MLFQIFLKFTKNIKAMYKYRSLEKERTNEVSERYYVLKDKQIKTNKCKELYASCVKLQDPSHNAQEIRKEGKRESKSEWGERHF